MLHDLGSRKGPLPSFLLRGFIRPSEGLQPAPLYPTFPISGVVFLVNT